MMGHSASLGYKPCGDGLGGEAGRCGAAWVQQVQLRGPGGAGEAQREAEGSALQRGKARKQVSGAELRMSSEHRLPIALLQLPCLLLPLQV